MRFGRREGISKESHRTNRAEDRLHISGAHIFKDGDEMSCNDYRGISVAPVLAKLYAMVLEGRITKWTEANGVRARSQAGFRAKFRTTYHIFTQQTRTTTPLWSILTERRSVMYTGVIVTKGLSKGAKVSEVQGQRDVLGLKGFKRLKGVKGSSWLQGKRSQGERRIEMID